MDNVILIFCDNRIYKTYKSHLRGHKLVTGCTSISIHKKLKHNSFFFHYVIEDSCNLFFTLSVLMYFRLQINKVFETEVPQIREYFYIEAVA